MPHVECATDSATTNVHHPKHKKRTSDESTIISFNWQPQRSRAMMISMCVSQSVHGATRSAFALIPFLQGLNWKLITTPHYPRPFNRSTFANNTRHYTCTRVEKHHNSTAFAWLYVLRCSEAHGTVSNWYQLFVLSLLFAVGILSPSLLTAPYLLLTLGFFILWSLVRPENYNTSTLRIIGILYTAIHFCAVYIYQVICVSWYMLLCSLLDNLSICEDGWLAPTDLNWRCDRRNGKGKKESPHGVSPKFKQIRDTQHEITNQVYFWNVATNPLFLKYNRSFWKIGANE